MLSSGFSESSKGSARDPNLDINDEGQLYAYESDSDLDEDESVPTDTSKLASKVEMLSVNEGERVTALASRGEPSNIVCAIEYIAVPIV